MPQSAFFPVKLFRSGLLGILRLLNILIVHFLKRRAVREMHSLAYARLDW